MNQKISKTEFRIYRGSFCKVSNVYDSLICPFQYKHTNAKASNKKSLLALKSTERGRKKKEKKIPKLTFMDKKTRFCLWNSARTATRSDLRRRDTWDLMNRSSCIEFPWRRLSSLATIKPSFPISFFLLHIDKLVLESKEPVKIFLLLVLADGTRVCKRMIFTAAAILLWFIRFRPRRRISFVPDFISTKYKSNILWLKWLKILGQIKSLIILIVMYCEII